MSRSFEQSPLDPEETLPRRLQEDLRSLYSTPAVPAAVEARILHQSAAAWAKQARHRRRLWWAGAGAAAAAALFVVILHQSGLEQASRPVAANAPTVKPIPGDVDRNGKVDILDAFAVARELRDPSAEPIPLSSGADLNGDGVVDEKDVDLIAQSAVRIGEPKVARANTPSHEGMGGTIQ